MLSELVRSVPGPDITVHRKQGYVSEMKPQLDTYFLSCPLLELKYAVD